ncbi:DUF2062 domain-containing protein [Marinicrinis sediminis]|uniref:DUF2062 domain-containing protein n=1 Tax=Marinicrinis sediminis TaxID=1652465 RepID=A0ABW5R6L2_9BACL
MNWLVKWSLKSRRNLKYYLIRLFRMKNSNHQISLGLILGFFPCWFPTFGIGPFLSIAITKIAKGNIVAAVFAAAIGSFLWPVLFYLNYQTGSLFLPDPPAQAALPDIEYNTAHYLQPIVNTFHKLGKSFMVGSFLNSVLFTFAMYGILSVVFSRYRERVLNKLKKSSAS